MIPNQKVFFLFGYGYVSSHLANCLMQEEDLLYTTTRSLNKRKSIEKKGIKSYVWNAGTFLDSQIRSTLSTTTHWVISIPPGEQENFFYNNPPADQLKHVIYISSTGVYGNKKGQWVDETSSTEPTTIAGKKRLQQEQWWIQWAKAHGVSLTIFRLSGIYGPGRNVLERIKRNTLVPVRSQESPIFSRIHIQDIVQIIAAYIAQMNKYDKSFCKKVFNLADKMPATYNEVLLYGYHLLQKQPPVAQPLNSDFFSPMFRQFAKESKKVNGSKILQDTGLSLLYPSYKEGLHALL